MELNEPNGSAANVGSMIYSLVGTLKVYYFNVPEHE